MKKSDFQKMSVEALEAEVRRHNELYFLQHAPEISDELFDQLVEILRKKKPDSFVLTELISDVREEGKKVKHAAPMLSLDKCYDEASLLSWASKFEGDVLGMPKIDGCAVSLHYDQSGKLSRAATRGSGIEGEDITANVHAVDSIPKQLKIQNVEVRGEVYMPLSIFLKYRETFANPRNLAAGAIKQKDPKKTGAYSLSFFAFDLLGTQAMSEVEKRETLQQQKIPALEWKLLKRDEMGFYFAHILKKRAALDFETDGVVFKVNLLSEQKRLGNTAHHPRYALAYKFQGDADTTLLLAVEWSVSRTGAITPVGIVEPVKLSGAIVKRTSLHNVGRMEKFGVTKGATVLMMRRGGVIPHLESVIEQGNEKIETPKVCPSCGSPTKRVDDFLYCTNPKRCVKSKVGEFAHFVKALEIDGFGEKLLEQLYEQGLVTDISEFYELTFDELLQLKRMGETLATKLLRHIQEKRKLSLETFLQSLGIREVGRQAAKLLVEYGDGEKIRSATEEELATLHGIGPVMAHEIVRGLKKKRKTIERLLKHVRLTHQPSTKKGPLSGKSFLFTGTLASMQRKEAEDRVEASGGVMAQSVTKYLDYLVVGDEGGAGSKLTKAEQLVKKGGKVKIISEKEFLKIITI